MADKRNLRLVDGDGNPKLSHGGDEHKRSNRPTNVRGTLWECEAFVRMFHVSQQKFIEAMRLEKEHNGLTDEQIDQFEDSMERELWELSLKPVNMRAKKVARDALLKAVEEIKAERELYRLMAELPESEDE